LPPAPANIHPLPRTALAGRLANVKKRPAAKGAAKEKLAALVRPLAVKRSNCIFIKKALQKILQGFFVVE